MTDAFPEPTPNQQLQVGGTVVEVMRQPLTTVELNDHATAAAYLMKHTGATALIVLDAQTDQPGPFTWWFETKTSWGACATRGHDRSQLGKRPHSCGMTLMLACPCSHPIPFAQRSSMAPTVG